MNHPKDFINKVIYGDCLLIMPLIPDEVVDLIYLDPPFGDNSIDAPYGLKWRDKAHYIGWMRERLIECRRILKNTGSIYLHCDYHSNAYLRLLMDNIFGVDNFRNEIIWCYTGPANSNMSQFSRKHDTIIWYSKKDKWIFHPDRLPYKDGKPHDGGFGNGFDPNFYKEKGGKMPEDWWIDITNVARLSKERVAYLNQKPVKLLKRIIEASSNRDDIILDPMCGSGTTLEAAWNLMRNYIGIDIDRNAVKYIEKQVKAEEN